MNKNEICGFFGCTMAQLNDQYKANAEILANMRDKAIKTGKKVGNATAKQLSEYTEKYKKLVQ